MPRLASSSGSVRTSSWLWSAEVAPCARKWRRRASSAARNRRSRRCPRRPPRRAAQRRPATRARRLQVAVRPEGRDHPARPRRVSGERGVRGQVVARIVGGGEHLDPEPIEEGARPVRVLGEPVGELVVDRVRGLRGRSLRHAEDLGELGLQPEAHRRSAEDVPMRAQRAPDLARRRLVELALPDAERVKLHAARVQQARHVVIGRDEQARRILERLIVEEDPRIDVAVRGDHRQFPRRRRTAGARSPARRAPAAAAGPDAAERHSDVGHDPYSRSTGQQFGRARRRG